VISDSPLVRLVMALVAVVVIIGLILSSIRFGY
jgi:hypothetical protein